MYRIAKESGVDPASLSRFMSRERGLSIESLRATRDHAGASNRDREEKREAMMRQQTAKRLRETAYHEAGHAVAALRLSVSFRYVDVVPEADRLGVVKHYQWVRSEDFKLALGGDGELTLRQRNRVERNIVLLLAGGAAQRRLAPKSKIGDESDLHTAFDLAARIIGEGDVLGKYVAYMQARARAFVGSRLNWILIERFAKKLIEERRVTGRTARRFLRQTIIDAVPPVSLRVISTDADGGVRYATEKK